MPYMPPPRKRADVVLVERGLFESRAKAQAAIAAGLVIANDVTVRKASETIAVTSRISRVAMSGAASRYSTSRRKSSRGSSVCLLSR